MSALIQQDHHKKMSLGEHYPDDLIEWYEISEMIDELQDDDIPKEFNEDGVISRIKNEANVFLGLNH